MVKSISKRSVVSSEASAGNEASYLRSSTALWDVLRAKAGLQISRNPTSLRSYDDAIYKELRQKLFSDSPGRFRSLLTVHKVNLETLLTVFLQAAAPFSRMLSRILQMYQKAAAVEGQENLKLVVQLDLIQGEKFEFSLAEFTRQVKEVELCIVTQNERIWLRDQLWSFPDALGSEGFSPALSKASDATGLWLAAYFGNRNHEFPALPPFPRTAVPWVDEVLLKIEDDLNAFLTRGRETFGNYANLGQREVSASDDDPRWPTAVVGWAAHDFWPSRVVVGVLMLCGKLRDRPSDSSALSAFNDIKAFVDELQITRVSKEQKVEALLNILNLPVWKRREAMYAVWVCAIALLDLGHCRVRYGVKNGRLEFPFSSRKIADITQPEFPTRHIEFWSELRTPAQHLLGKTRKKAIQPDYRYRVHEEGREALDAIILECKQYRRSNSSNFSSAIIDYARASPVATVILCNYGPVLSTVLEKVHAIAPDVCSRVSALGQVRPRGDGEFLLRRNLRKALAHLIAAPDATDWSIGKVTVELMWLSSGIDLDLHLRQGAAWTNFQSPSGIKGSEYPEDQHGDNREVSTERIYIEPSGVESYSILVHRYSGGNSLQQAGPEVSIFFATGVEYVATAPPGVGDWWHVADLRQGYSKPILVNRILQNV